MVVECKAILNLKIYIMSKLKENTLFTLFFLIGYIAVFMGLDLFLEKEESWFEIILRSSFVVFILLIAKIFGFLDKKKKSAD